jgi:hypothetical protein
VLTVLEHVKLGWHARSPERKKVLRAFFGWRFDVRIGSKYKRRRRPRRNL